jgi:hypothetical protein
MQNLRTAFLTAVVIALITLAITSIAERDAQAHLDRALQPTPVVQTLSDVSAVRYSRSVNGE